MTTVPTLTLAISARNPRTITLDDPTVVPVVPPVPPVTPPPDVTPRLRFVNSAGIELFSF